jgi:hypothetical protein
LNGGKQMDEIIEEIKNYSPHTELLTLSTLIAVNQKINVINMSNPGLGKSRVTAELLKELDIPFEFIAGRITPKIFFRKLQSSADKGMMIIDESATLLSNATIKELLLSALWGGEVSWETERETLIIPNYRGTIIFNTNKIGNDAFTKALKDRVIFNELILSGCQIKDKILSRKDYRFNSDLWAKIKENTLGSVELDENDDNKIWSIISKIHLKSVRDEWRIRKISRGLKNILGSIDYIENFIKIDKIEDILLDDKITRAEKVKIIAKLKNISERGARKLVKKNEIN